MTAVLLCLSLSLSNGCSPKHADGVFVEAETFANLGGWVVDQQFMPTMGSPFLLAHGLGSPVADAVTRVKFPAPGVYRVHVRTRDWVSPQGPGRFRVRVGEWVSRELGAGEGAWHWEDCGELAVAGEEEVRLCDSTGFEGRVDALCFRRADGAVQRPAVEPVDGGRFDFVVVGGGFAGMCAAVSAARQGLKTALVQDRPVFGGNGSNECRVRPHGILGLAPFPRNSDHMYELWSMMPAFQGDACGDDYRLDDAAVGAWLAAETNLAVFASTSCIAAETNGCGEIASVVLHEIRTARRLRLRGRLFCDATGDAALAEQAGARTRWDAESFEETGEELAPPARERRRGGGLESTCQWHARPTRDARPFPSCPWALDISCDEDALIGAEIGKTNWIHSGGWSWGAGYYHDPVREGEAIRDWNFRAVYGLWDYLKNKAAYRANYEKAEIYWLGHVLAKRDAHRIVGDYVVTANDMTEGRAFDDGVVTTTWYLDLHFPHPRVEAKFPDGAFRAGSYEDASSSGRIGKYTPIKPFAIPYRCFYSADVPNLFAAGKDISGTYAALGSYRVENTCAQMGTMVGRAAALCVRLGVSPRALGAEHLAELKAFLSNPGPERPAVAEGRRRTAGLK